MVKNVANLFYMLVVGIVFLKQKIIVFCNLNHSF